MSYIGNKPATNFETVQKQISTSNSGTTITLDRAVTSVQDILLTIDAVVQSYDNYSVSGTTLTVGGTLSNNRVEILYVGRTMQSVDPTDDSVSASKIKTDAVTTAKVQNDAITVDKLNLISTSRVPSLEAKGDGSSQDGYIQLNCSQNSHGVKLKSPPHSANQSYTLTLPSTAPASNKIMQTDGSGNLSFIDTPSGLFTQTGFTTISASQTINVDGVFSSTYKNYMVIIEGYSHQNSTSQLYFGFRTGTSGSNADGGGTIGGVSAGRLRESGSDPSFMGNDSQNDSQVRLTTDVYNNEYSSLQMYVFNPYVTSRRSTISGRAPYREGSTSRVGFTDFGHLSISSEQHTGFKIYTQGSFNSGGTITVYGMTDGS